MTDILDSRVSASASRYFFTRISERETFQTKVVNESEYTFVPDIIVSQFLRVST
jgi:hypothetical protein